MPATVLGTQTEAKIMSQLNPEIIEAAIVLEAFGVDVFDSVDIDLSGDVTIGALLKEVDVNVDLDFTSNTTIVNVSSTGVGTTVNIDDNLSLLVVEAEAFGRDTTVEVTASVQTFESASSHVVLSVVAAADDN